ncbi:MAG: tyrosine--tRNA ligase [Actinomycetota bacterium]|nr:tyrosine--tRNA ligase [Actinomycetota bacterium]
MDAIAELIWRGMVHQVTDEELAAKMAAGRFVVYHGMDATADSLHVGNLIGVLALQRLQRAGHRPIALLGGATTLIGDPSGKASERQMRTVDEVRANVFAIRGQLERFLTFGSGPTDALLLDNADWLTQMTLTDFLRDVGKHFTVNTMIAKESVRARLETREQGISYTEFSYMLLQAYDFLHLHDAHGCHLQIGGSDQWGNITAGVDLVRRVRGTEVYGLTWPLLTKADGTKFGKTESGTIWLSPQRTSPYEFFQFWMRTDDRDVMRLLRLFTDLDQDRMAELEAAHAARPERREAHQALAWEVTAAVHGPEEAEAARRAAAALYGGELHELDGPTLLEVFAEAPSASVPRSELEGDGAALVDLLVQASVVPSKSAARRELQQGGIYVNNRQERDGERRVRADDLLAGGYLVLRRGKRNYHLVKFSG